MIVAPALGGPERRVAHQPQHATFTYPSLSWTPDGKWLATAEADPAGRHRIVLLPLEQGEKRRLTSNSGSGPDVWPALSPDGRWLAYGACSGPYTCDVHLLPLDASFAPAGPARRLTREGFFLFGITWSSDGRELLVSASRSGAIAPYLWRLAIPAGTTPERIEIAGPMAGTPTIPRVGDRLVFNRGISDSDVWRIDLPGPPKPLLQSTKSEYEPDLSPDGTTDRLLLEPRVGGPRGLRQPDRRLEPVPAHGRNRPRAVQSPVVARRPVDRVRLADRGRRPGRPRGRRRGRAASPALPHPALRESTGLVPGRALRVLQLGPLRPLRGVARSRRGRRGGAGHGRRRGHERRVLRRANALLRQDAVRPPAALRPDARSARRTEGRRCDPRSDLRRGRDRCRVSSLGARSPGLFRCGTSTLRPGPPASWRGSTSCPRWG